MASDEKRLIQLAGGLHYLPKPKASAEQSLAGNGKRSSLIKRRDEMKKLTTVLAMIALTLTFSTIAFGQNGSEPSVGCRPAQRRPAP
jgi:hypothetical protein